MASSTPLILISAMSRDRVIGRENGLPWNVPEEYQHFLGLIEGQTILMGRRSYEIFGADMNASHVVVVSRSATIPGVTVCPTLDDALEAARSFGKTVFSAGGARVYEQTLPIADAMYLSHMKGEFEGDTHFPAFDEADWRVEKRVEHAEFEFVVYRRPA